MIFDNTDTNQKIYDDLLRVRRAIIDKVEICDYLIKYLDVVQQYDSGNVKKARLFEQEKSSRIDYITNELDNIPEECEDHDGEAIFRILARINFVRHMQSLNIGSG